MNAPVDMTDITRPFKTSSEGNQYLLSRMDHYLMARGITTKRPSSLVYSLIIHKDFARHGACNTLFSD